MKMSDYQHEAMKFAKYDDHTYPFMALAEEAGEVMGKIAKFVRKHEMPCWPAELENPEMYRAQEGVAQLQSDLKKELGDVLWQLAACANALNCTLDEIAVGNLYKLRDREARGVIVGEGDAR